MSWCPQGAGSVDTCCRCRSSVVPRVPSCLCHCSALSPASARPANVRAPSQHSEGSGVPQCPRPARHSGDTAIPGTREDPEAGGPEFQASLHDSARPCLRVNERARVQLRGRALAWRQRDPGSHPTQGPDPAPPSWPGTLRIRPHRCSANSRASSGASPAFRPLVHAVQLESPQ